jgi:hypothetical protein
MQTRKTRNIEKAGQWALGPPPGEVYDPLFARFRVVNPGIILFWRRIQTVNEKWLPKSLRNWSNAINQPSNTDQITKRLKKFDFTVYLLVL